MSFTSEEGGFLKPLLEEETADDARGGVEQATTPRRSPPPSQVMLRKKTQRYGEKSFYNKHSQWAASDKGRSVYMNDLLLQRQQAINNLFPGEDQDEEEGGAHDSSPKLSMEMHSDFVRHLQDAIDRKDTVKMPSVEIRVKNFSFDVPLSEGEAEGKSKIPTVFNHSPIYWCKKAGEKVMRTKKIESATGRKEVKHVLKNVNLALEPGKMYLIIGPPSSGKTSLLNGE